MAAFFGDLLLESIRFIILIGVSLAGIFCGKKLRDRKDTKAASDYENGK